MFDDDPRWGDPRDRDDDVREIEVHWIEAERVQAVAAFGFTERQARFLVTVLVHSGVFIERQYRAFAVSGLPAEALVRSTFAASRLRRTTFACDRERRLERATGIEPV